MLLGRTSWAYRSRAKDTTALRLRLRELAEARRRFGYRRLHVLLLREGWRVNHKKIYRLCGLEDLAVEKRERRKRVSHARVLPASPAATPNERWSMDFVSDSFDDGRRFRALTLVDTYTRECLALVADVSLSGHKVAAILDGVARERGCPKRITVDNGTEFYSRAMDSWAYRRGVQLDFIRRGRPMENGFIESFNGRLRDECLNGELFLGLVRCSPEARSVEAGLQREASTQLDREPDADRVRGVRQGKKRERRGGILNLKLAQKNGAGQILLDHRRIHTSSGPVFREQVTIAEICLAGRVGQRPVAERRRHGSGYFRLWPPLNVPEYIVAGGTTYRLVTDQVGSVRLVLNTSTGAIAQRIARPRSMVFRKRPRKSLDRQHLD